MVLGGALCAAMAAAVILITLLILRREGRELMVVERAIARLGDLNLSADQELEVFCGRTDETGMIAETTHRVCGCLRETIDDPDQHRTLRQCRTCIHLLLGDYTPKDRI